MTISSFTRKVGHFAGLSSTLFTEKDYIQRIPCVALQLQIGGFQNYLSLQY